MIYQKKSWKVGTRGSELAKTQTQWVIDQLKQHHPDCQFEIKVIVTSGDRIQDRFLSEVGGKGLFIKEIEESLTKGEIDFGVHSLKDLPSPLNSNFCLAAFPKRESPYDVLLTKGRKFEELSPSSVVGTASLRRRVQLKSLRKDLRFELLRGNINTRIKKLESGQFDAIVLAEAALQRLGKLSLSVERLPIVPAPGQGTLGIETLTDNIEVKKLLQCLNFLPTQIESETERTVMAGLGGECSLPLGVFAKVIDQELTLEVFIGNEDASQTMTINKVSKVGKHLQLSEELMLELEKKGADQMIRQIKEASKN